MLILSHVYGRHMQAMQWLSMHRVLISAHYYADFESQDIKILNFGVGRSGVSCISQMMQAITIYRSRVHFAWSLEIST